MSKLSDWYCRHRNHPLREEIVHRYEKPSARYRCIADDVEYLRTGCLCGAIPDSGLVEQRRSGINSLTLSTPDSRVLDKTGYLAY